MAQNRIHNLSIQWHVTTRCGNRCRHCYMYDGARYETEKQREMDLAGLLRILDSIAAFGEKWEAKVLPFAVSGGDPLLHPDWAAFMGELKLRGKVLSAYALDVLGRRFPALAPPSENQVRSYLRQAARARLAYVSTPGAGQLARLSGAAAGSALIMNGSVTHLGLFQPVTILPVPSPRR